MRSCLNFSSYPPHIAVAEYTSRSFLHSSHKISTFRVACERRLLTVSFLRTTETIMKEAITSERVKDGSICIDQIVFTVDLNGYFTYVNLAAELLLGYSPDELLQMNLTEIVAPEQREYVQQQITDFTDERLGAVYEIEIVTKSDRRMQVEMSTRVVTHDARAIARHGIALPLTGVADFRRSNRARCLDERFTFLAVFESAIPL